MSTVGVAIAAFLLLLALPFLISGIWALALNFPRFGWWIQWLLDSYVRATLHYNLGDVSEAQRVLEPIEPERPLVAMIVCNVRIIILTAAGRYREAALARPLLTTRAPSRRLRKADPRRYGLLAINRVEALYNLGQWKRAERLMRAVVDAGLCTDSTNSQGGAAQLAWIWANRGDLEAAAFVAERVEVDKLPRDYRAEAFFTRAFVGLKSGDVIAAHRHLDEAGPHLRRASSKRNELFLRAWAMELEGKDDAALALYERASSCTFRGQGGDGLLRWGDLLARRGDGEGAKKAWELAIARDQESESAKTARSRLGPDVPG